MTVIDSQTWMAENLNYNSKEGYANKGYDTIFWSADESTADTAQSRFLCLSDESVISGGWSKTEEISVRCIED